MANMLLGNMNNTIMLRTVDVDTQERLSKRLPEVPISYVMKTTGSSMGDESHTGAFAINHGERLMSEDKSIIAPQVFGDLSDLEFFAIYSKGNLVKGRLPILAPPDDAYRGPSVEHYNHATARASYAFDEGADPDQDQPGGQGGAVAAADGVAPRPGAGAVVAPPVQVIELHPDLQPPPPSRHGLLPLMRWIEILPRFRANDRHHEIKLLPPPKPAEIEPVVEGHETAAVLEGDDGVQSLAT